MSLLLPSPTVLGAIGLTALVLVAGAYIKGRSDGKKIAAATYEVRVAQIKADYAKAKELAEAEFARRQVALAREIERRNKELADLAVNEEALREVADGYAAEIASRNETQCLLTPEDAARLQ